jgi:TrmH family RNA methyltransferase
MITELLENYDNSKMTLERAYANNLRIVLVETTHPGNIGATARAMKNMGLRRLVLVKPAHFPHAEATARAAGADDILAQAQVVNSLNIALQGCHGVLGTTARDRGLSGPELDPHQCALQVAEFCSQGEAALVFGRESSGLTNDELDLCHYRIRIPTNPAFSSLNLAAAVTVVVYEVRKVIEAAVVQTPEPQSLKPRELPASADEMANFYQHLEQVLLETGFLNPANPRHLMRQLRRLFNRSQPNKNEVNILRGMLTSVQKRINRQ